MDTTSVPTPYLSSDALIGVVEPSRRNKWLTQERRRSLWGMAFALPAMVFFALFAIYPILRTFYLSFFEYSVVDPQVYTGTSNYREIIGDDRFATSLLNTFKYVAFTYIPVLILALRWFGTGQSEKAGRFLFGGTAVFVMLTLIFFIKRIEGYSQRAAIEFFESKAGEDVYFTTHGYKSYAQYFYARTMPYSNPNAADRNWLIEGPVDKDVYIVTKNYHAGYLLSKPDMEQIGAKNGFVFFKRKHAPPPRSN